MKIKKKFSLLFLIALSFVSLVTLIPTASAKSNKLGDGHNLNLSHCHMIMTHWSLILIRKQ
ncbi:MAG: hypothetical protein KH415_13525 [Clostridium sp.]|nr:hypothetical protein [Clostridium sp.]